MDWKHCRRRGAGLLVCLVMAWGTTARGDLPHVIEWSRQLGTPETDAGRGVAVDDSGHAWVTGSTLGDLAGPNVGDRDAFLVKFDPGGGVLWSRQIGTSTTDLSWDVATDGSGNAWITGETRGDLGGVNGGIVDGFLSKVDADGNVAWSRQIDSPSSIVSNSVFADPAGNAYVAGHTTRDLSGNSLVFNAFVMKFDGAGNRLWAREVGTPGSEVGLSITGDRDGNSFLVGRTSGDLGGPNAGKRDAFLTKLDPAGQIAWSRQLGSAENDQSTSVAVDEAGNILVTGRTWGDLAGEHQGSTDFFVAKYDPAGDLLWSEQMGSADADDAFSMAVDDAGDVFVSGATDGDLGDEPIGTVDAFLTKLDSTGNHQWTQRIGTPRRDRSFGVAVNGSNDVWLTGSTDGDLGGEHAGRGDGFLVKLSVIPAPTAFPVGLMLLGGLALHSRRPVFRGFSTAGRARSG